MAETVKGRGVVWSVGGITMVGGVLNSGNDLNMVQSLRFSRTSDNTLLKDNGGTIRGRVFHAFKRSLSITVIPYGTGINAARESMEDHMLTPGIAVTITDSIGAVIDATSNNANIYNVTRVSQGRTVDGVATVELELEQGDEGNDLSTTVS